MGDPRATYGLLPVTPWVTYGRPMGYYHEVLGRTRAIHGRPMD